MTRARRAQDWERDLTAARAAENALAEILRRDPRIEDLIDRTKAFDRLDFGFRYQTMPVELDLKEKIRPTSAALASLWPDVAPANLFVVDETVYRRIVWHGGGGYLVVHDHPGARWAIFGPWELTLGPRRRYRRWGDTGSGPFAKGKLLLDLDAAARVDPEFSVDALLEVVDRSMADRDAVDAVGAAPALPEVGRPAGAQPAQLTLSD